MSHPDFRPEDHFRPEALSLLRPRHGRAQGIYKPSLGRTQAAAHCDMSSATFDRRRAAGEIPSFTDERGDLRFYIEDLDRFIALRREAQERAERDAHARREAERQEREGEIKPTPELAQARDRAKRAAADVRASETEIPRLRREAARLQDEVKQNSDTDPAKIVARESRLVEVDKLIPAQERALHARRQAAAQADAELQKALAQARGVARVERAVTAHIEAETAAAGGPAGPRARTRCRRPCPPRPERDEHRPPAGRGEDRGGRALLRREPAHARIRRVDGASRRRTRTRTRASQAPEQARVTPHNEHGDENMPPIDDPEFDQLEHEIASWCREAERDEPRRPQRQPQAERRPRREQASEAFQEQAHQEALRQQEASRREIEAMDPDAPGLSGQARSYMRSMRLGWGLPASPNRAPHAASHGATRSGHDQETLRLCRDMGVDPADFEPEDASATHARTRSAADDERDARKLCRSMGVNYEDFADDAPVRGAHGLSADEREALRDNKQLVTLKEQFDRTPAALAERYTEALYAVLGQWGTDYTTVAAADRSFRRTLDQEVAKVLGVGVRDLPANRWPPED